MFKSHAGLCFHSYLHTALSSDTISGGQLSSSATAASWSSDVACCRLRSCGRSAPVQAAPKEATWKTRVFVSDASSSYWGMLLRQLPAPPFQLLLAAIFATSRPVPDGAMYCGNCSFRPALSLESFSVGDPIFLFAYVFCIALAKLGGNSARLPSGHVILQGIKPDTRRLQEL